MATSARHLPPTGEVCHHWIGSDNRYCSSTVGVRRYLPGLCCPLHTPGEVARKAGLNR